MQRKVFNGPELAVLRLALADYIYTLVNHPKEREQAEMLFRKLAPAERDEVMDDGVLTPSLVLHRVHCLNKAIYGRGE